MSKHQISGAGDLSQQIFAKLLLPHRPATTSVACCILFLHKVIGNKKIPEENHYDTPYVLGN